MDRIPVQERRGEVRFCSLSVLTKILFLEEFGEDTLANEEAGQGVVWRESSGRKLLTQENLHGTVYVYHERRMKNHMHYEFFIGNCEEPLKSNQGNILRWFCAGCDAVI